MWSGSVLLHCSLLQRYSVSLGRVTNWIIGVTWAPELARVLFNLPSVEQPHAPAQPLLTPAGFVVSPHGKVWPALARAYNTCWRTKSSALPPASASGPCMAKIRVCLPLSDASSLLLSYVLGITCPRKERGLVTSATLFPGFVFCCSWKGGKICIWRTLPLRCIGKTQYVLSQPSI